MNQNTDLRVGKLGEIRDKKPRFWSAIRERKSKTASTICKIRVRVWRIWTDFGEDSAITSGVLEPESFGAVLEENSGLGLVSGLGAFWEVFGTKLGTRGEGSAFLHGSHKFVPVDDRRGFCATVAMTRCKTRKVSRFLPRAGGENLYGFYSRKCDILMNRIHGIGGARGQNDLIG